MNFPGRAGGNWRWRFTDDMLSSQSLEGLHDLTKSSSRLGIAGTSDSEKVLEVASQ